MMRHFSIGPASLQTLPVLIIIGVLIALEVTRRVSRNHDEKLQETAQNTFFWGFIVWIIGARISYGLLHWDAYQDDLGGWFSLTTQGLHTIGGFIILMIFMAVYVGWRGVSWRTYIDLIAPGISAFMVVLSLGFLAQGDVIGQPSDLPWAIDLWGEQRHPTQLYAAFGGLVTLMLWWQSSINFEGGSALLILAGNALTWLLVGFLLAEPTLLANYRLAQVLGWLSLVLAALLWNVWSTEPESSLSHAEPPTPLER